MGTPMFHSTDFGQDCRGLRLTLLCFAFVSVLLVSKIAGATATIDISSILTPLQDAIALLTKVILS